jgi:general secretion pathway protein G
MRKPNSAQVRKQGFTLIELLVVLAIVATLLLLVSPRYLNQLEASREATLRDNLRTIRLVIDSFYGDHGRYPESLDELVERRYLRSLPVDPITESSETWLIVETQGELEGVVYDVRSGAQGRSRAGNAYAEW